VKFHTPQFLEGPGTPRKRCQARYLLARIPSPKPSTRGTEECNCETISKELGSSGLSTLCACHSESTVCQGSEFSTKIYPTSHRFISSLVVDPAQVIGYTHQFTRFTRYIHNLWPLHSKTCQYLLFFLLRPHFCTFYPRIGCSLQPSDVAEKIIWLLGFHQLWHLLVSISINAPWRVDGQV